MTTATPAAKGTTGEARTVEPEFGLNKTEVYVAGPARYPDRKTLATTLYIAHDGAGRLTNLMACGIKGLDPWRPNCAYWFIADGLTFKLTLADPSQWQAVERTLTEKFASFESNRAH
jgi:hypothetical protein